MATGLEILADDEDAFTGPLSDKGLSSTFDSLGSSLGSTGSRVGAGLLGGFQQTRLGVAIFGHPEAAQQAANDKYLEQDLRRRTAEFRFDSLQAGEARAVERQGWQEDQQKMAVERMKFSRAEAAYQLTVRERQNAIHEQWKVNRDNAKTDRERRLADKAKTDAHTKLQREEDQRRFKLAEEQGKVSHQKADKQLKVLASERNQIERLGTWSDTVKQFQGDFYEAARTPIPDYRVSGVIERSPLIKEYIEYSLGAKLFIKGGADPEKLSFDFSQWMENQRIKMEGSEKDGFRLVDTNDINPETGKPIVLASGETKAGVYESMGQQIEERRTRLFDKMNKFLVHEETDGASYAIDIIKRFSLNGFIRGFDDGEQTWEKPDDLKLHAEVEKMVYDADGQGPKRYGNMYRLYSMYKTLPPSITGSPETGITNGDDLEDRTGRMIQYAKNIGVGVVILPGRVEFGTEGPPKAEFKHDELTGGKWMESGEFMKQIEATNPIVKGLMQMERNIKRSADDYNAEMGMGTVKDDTPSMANMVNALALGTMSDVSPALQQAYYDDLEDERFRKAWFDTDKEDREQFQNYWISEHSSRQSRKNKEGPADNAKRAASDTAGFSTAFPKTNQGK
jgi:hypothetical protein